MASLGSRRSQVTKLPMHTGEIRDCLSSLLKIRHAVVWRIFLFLSISHVVKKVSKDILIGFVLFSRSFRH